MMGRFSLPRLAALLLGGSVLVGLTAHYRATEAEELPVATVPHLNEATFAATLASEQLPLVIDFFATWCGPCKAAAPIIEALAAEMPGVRFAKVDIEEAPTIVGEYGIQSVPTFVVIRDGKRVGTIVGVVPKAQLKAKIEGLLE